jgi:hypothetical protein
MIGNRGWKRGAAVDLRLPHRFYSRSGCWRQMVSMSGLPAIRTQPGKPKISQFAAFAERIAIMR